MEFVNGKDDYSIYEMEKVIQMFETTSRIWKTHEISPAVPLFCGETSSPWHSLVRRTELPVVHSRRRFAKRSAGLPSWSRSKNCGFLPTAVPVGHAASHGTGVASRPRPCCWLQGKRPFHCSAARDDHVHVDLIGIEWDRMGYSHQDFRDLVSQKPTLCRKQSVGYNMI